MSLLLEALQRADSERKHQGDVPGIDTQHSVAASTEPDNTRHWMLVALALIILLLLVYVVYLQSAATEPVTIPTSVEASANSSDKPAQLDHQQAQALANTPPAEPGSPAAEKARNTANAKQAEVAALYARLKEENKASITADRPHSSQQAATIPAPAPITTDRFNEPGEQLNAEIDQQNAAEEVYSSIPFASQLPSQQQNQIPPLRYTTHGYAPETGRGLVTLNGRSQRRGDTIAPGLILLDIRADYIVLDMNGVLFRLQAATDWN